MANEFQVSNIIAKEMLPYISEGNVMTSAKEKNVSRTYEAEWNRNDGLDIGTEIRLPLPNYHESLDEFEGETQTSFVQKKTVTLKIEKHFYKQIEINISDETFNIKNFMQNQVRPIMDVFARGIEAYVFNKMKTSCYNYVELGGANGPTSNADAIKLSSKFNKLKVATGSRKLVLTSTAYENAMGIDSILKANERGSNEVTATGFIADHMGMRYYHSNQLDDVVFEPSNFSGGVLKGALVKDQDNKVVTLDGCTEGDVITAGSIIKLGTASIVAKSDATVDAAGEVAIPVEKVGFNVPDNTEATLAQVGGNFGFSPNAFTLAMVTPAQPAGNVDSSVAVDPETGAALRVTVTYDGTHLKNLATFHVFVGGGLVVPEHAYRF